MELGMIGLGRMGGNMAARLIQGGHNLVVFDPNAEAVQAQTAAGATGASSIADLAAALAPPRAVWSMVPSGEPTESTVNAVADTLSPGDTVIDGGNSNYKDSMRRAAVLKERGLSYLDIGTSGGIWGLAEGVLPHGGWRARRLRAAGAGLSDAGLRHQTGATDTSVPRAQGTS